MFSDEGDVDVYVPGGTWTGYLDGAPVSGPGWVRRRHGFDSLPLLVRPGAVVPVGGLTDRPDYKDAVAPTFEVFGLADGGRTVVRLFDGAGAEHVVVEVSRTGAELRGVVTRGLEHLVEGWTLRWVTGLQGADRGPAVQAAARGRRGDPRRRVTRSHRRAVRR